MRHRLLDIDDRLEELALYQRRHPRRWLEFQHLYEKSWIYHENILDGVALDPQEIDEALASDITRDISLISLYRRIRNYRTAIGHVQRLASARTLPYSVELCKELHGILVAGGEEVPGRFRRNSPVHRAYFQDICPPGQVPYHLEQAVEALNRWEQRPKEHALSHVANVHHKLMYAYPFSAWSGAVGRLLGNLVLMRAGAMPLVIHCQDRQRYYQALAQAPEQLLRLYAETAENNLDNAFHHFVSLQGASAARSG